MDQTLSSSYLRHSSLHSSSPPHTGTDTDFSPSSSVFPYQCNSTIAQLPTLCNLSNFHLS